MLTAVHMIHRLLAEEAERALEEHQRRLALKDTDLRTSEDKLRILDERVSELTRCSGSDQDHIAQLKVNIRSYSPA